jgi:hypothetical protein
MVLALGLLGKGALGKVAEKFEEKRKKKKNKNYQAGVQAGMEKAGGGAGMSQLKKGGMVGKKKAKAKKTGGAPHNRLY